MPTQRRIRLRRRWEYCQTVSAPWHNWRASIHRPPTLACRGTSNRSGPVGGTSAGQRRRPVDACAPIAPGCGYCLPILLPSPQSNSPLGWHHPGSRPGSGWLWQWWVPYNWISVRCAGGLPRRWPICSWLFPLNTLKGGGMYHVVIQVGVDVLKWPARSCIVETPRLGHLWMCLPVLPY